MRWGGKTYRQWVDRMCERPDQAFALFPTQMDSGEWVWLERYWWGFFSSVTGLVPVKGLTEDAVLRVMYPRYRSRPADPQPYKARPKEK